jgi:hypothetical protein
MLNFGRHNFLERIKKTVGGELVRVIGVLAVTGLAEAGGWVGGAAPWLHMTKDALKYSNRFYRAGQLRTPCHE